MASCERLLVSCGCIFHPAERRVGRIGEVEVPDATSVLFHLKVRFGSDIYVILDSAFLKSRGREYLAKKGYLNERQGDLDIVGYDRLIELDEVTQSLVQWAENTKITHAVLIDASGLYALREIVPNRFLFETVRHEKDVFVKSVSGWLEIKAELLC